VNLNKAFGVKEALSHVASMCDHTPCSKCDKHAVIYCWPKMRNPKSQPECGDVLLRPATRDHGQETRHVSDRTLGGDVIYCVGRRPVYDTRRDNCTAEEWARWAEDAIVVEVAEGVPV